MQDGNHWPRNPPCVPVSSTHHECDWHSAPIRSPRGVKCLNMKVGRREFLKKAGLGSIALGSLPAWINALATPALAQGRRGFAFDAITRAGPEGTASSPAHTLIMAGQGHFDPARIGSPVDGGGVFTHTTLPGPTPRPIVASGTWKARLLVSYKEIGTWGVFAAGISEMVVDLFTQLPSPAVVRGARLKVVCNIGAAALINPGEMEGYTLSIPGTDFFTGGTPGSFQAIPPGGVGLTIFSTAIP